MTTATTEISTSTLEQELNGMILSGKALDAFEKFYSEDIAMQENDDDPFVGKDLNRKREKDFFASIEEVHQFNLDSWAAGDDVSFSEWTYDITFKGGSRAKWGQTAVRRWKDGKVIHERFYHKTLG